MCQFVQPISCLKSCSSFATTYQFFLLLAQKLIFGLFCTTHWKEVPSTHNQHLPALYFWPQGYDALSRGLVQLSESLKNVSRIQSSYKPINFSNIAFSQLNLWPLGSKAIGLIIVDKELPTKAKKGCEPFSFLWCFVFPKGLLFNE